MRKRATESAPPETATPTRAPGWNICWLLIARKTRVCKLVCIGSNGTRAHYGIRGPRAFASALRRNSYSLQSKQGEQLAVLRVWLGRVSNPRPRRYECRALTN